MNNILVTTDFLVTSKNALEYAKTLSKHIGLGITLFHAFRTPPYDKDDTSAKHLEESLRLKNEFEAKLDAMSNEIKLETGNPCNYVVKEGFAKEEIVLIADELRPDLLIMGTENLTPIDRFVFGSKAGRAMREVNCTIMVVPQNTAFKPPSKIAFAVDFHESDHDNTKFINQLGKSFNCETHLIHIVDSESDFDFDTKQFLSFREKINKEIPGNAIHFHLIEGHNAADDIDEYVKLNQIDLLALAKTDKTTVFDRLFVRSLTQKIYYFTEIPLLVFQAEDGVNDLL